MPSAIGETLTLDQVAELCRHLLAACRGRSLVPFRDRLIAVAVEWDLGTDLLRDQSDLCIQELAALLGDAA